MSFNWHRAFWLAVAANILAAVIYDWSRRQLLERRHAAGDTSGWPS